MRLTEITYNYPTSNFYSYAIQFVTAMLFNMRYLCYNIFSQDVPDLFNGHYNYLDVGLTKVFHISTHMEKPDYFRCVSF